MSFIFTLFQRPFATFIALIIDVKLRIHNGVTTNSPNGIAIKTPMLNSSLIASVKGHITNTKKNTEAIINNTIEILPAATALNTSNV